AITQQIRDIEAERDVELSRVPNMIHASVPKGKSAADNKVVAEHGPKPAAASFKRLPHWDLAQNLGLLQMETGAKLAGSGFYALKGDLARLEWALISYFLDCAHKAGYTQWMVPVVASEPTMYGTGYLPKMRDQVYHMDERDPGLFLIPTAEAPLTSIHAGDELKDDQLPLCYAAWSACFRREAGAAGTGTRGLLRVHQFNKVELFKLAHPDRSHDDHAALRADAEKVIQGLGLHYRVLELCDADLSFAGAKCWDLEVWSPGVEEWLEVSSVSNFEEFQARRCNIRFRDAESKKLRYCHTINGSGLATPRVLVALIENGQQADGSIVVPEALRPWMGGQQRIGG
ncbi:MAG: serine--tRNA ligase, partial [Planctomycetota bacterium]